MQTGASIDQDRQLRTEWEASPSLRAEFIDFAAFSAFRRAEACGRVKPVTGRVRGSLRHAPEKE